MNFKLKDTFNKTLPADPDKNNTRRQVFNACYSFVKPKKPLDPKLIHVSEEMATELGFSNQDINSENFLNYFSGKVIIPDTEPYAMCYGGHQFGHWAGQLGDGRAINLCEVVNNNNRWALQLKGAGETPYSRSADGLAVLRSSIREHLCSEAMHHLGVPTTRSLSLCLSGDQVMRDMMYDGNQALEKGAVVCRVAPSFIRFGNFQIFASRDDKVNLQKLADYTIKHFFPDLIDQENKYLNFFEQVAKRSLEMVLHWERVGFVHGVMNTDNMSILGLTIDYGPYGWIDNYDRNWTPNTTDIQHKRYRFGNQAPITQWNLFQLANALFPLVGEAKGFESVLENFKNDYRIGHLAMQRNKLGLSANQSYDQELIDRLKDLNEQSQVDYVIFFRKLSEVKKDKSPEQALAKVEQAFYDKQVLEGDKREQWILWFENYLSRLKLEQQSDEDRKIEMDKINPKYVLRNYMAQLAIEAADKGDYSLIEALYNLLKKPYADQIENEKWFAKRPDWALNKIGCSMLSCSS